MPSTSNQATVARVFLAYSYADLKIGATSGENTAMWPNEDGMFMNETACGPLVAVRAD